MKFFNFINFSGEGVFSINRSGKPTNRLFITEHLRGGTSIRAIEVEIKQATHKTSYINAEYANIHTHGGIIEGGDIKVKHLKGGKIIANTATVDFLENGIIEADYIYIKRLGSRNLLTATDIIEIDKVDGVKNTITVNPIFDMEKLDKLSELYEKVMFYKRESVSTQKMAYAKRLDMESRVLEAQKCRAKIKSAEDSGEVPEDHLMVAVKEFDLLSRDYRRLVSTIETLKEHMDVAATEFRAYLWESGFVPSQKIVCRSPWRENNKIIFNLPKHNLSYNPSKGEDAHELYLWHNSGLLLEANGEFDIKINKKE
ncbi:MAG: hypothetical protein LBQ18_08865 [Campylobacteraceae bacterium]|nr:hypothetical protein [Campylobacteraceae bacterium]